MTVSVDAHQRSPDHKSVENRIIDYSELEDLLVNRKGETALHQRFRALFYLKGLGTDRSIDIIAKGMLIASRVQFVSLS